MKNLVFGEGKKLSIWWIPATLLPLWETFGLMLSSSDVVKFCNLS